VAEPVETLDAHPDECQIWAVRAPRPRLLLRMDGATWQADGIGTCAGLATDWALPGCPTVDVYHLAVRGTDEAAVITWLCNHTDAGIPALEHDLAAALRLGGAPPCVMLVVLAYRQAGLDIAHLCGQPLPALRPEHLPELARLHPARCLYRGRLQFTETRHAPR